MIANISDVGEILKTTFLANPIVLQHVSWQDYQILQDKVCVARPRMKMTFVRNEIKILSAVTSFHEYIKATLGSLVSCTMFETKVNISGTGEATLRSKELGIATEPDASFFVGKSVKLSKQILDETQTFPDIVVEIDESHKSDDKFEIYAAFGIKEFWLYDGGLMRIFELSETGEYLLSDNSLALPILTAEVLTDFLNRSQTNDQFQVLTDFQAWLQENK